MSDSYYIIKMLEATIEDLKNAYIGILNARGSSRDYSAINDLALQIAEISLQLADILTAEKSYAKEIIC